MGYDEEYEGLLSKAKSTPESADFQQLRFAYARSSQYNPYGASTADLWALGEVIGHADGETAMGAIDETLESNYLDIRAHLLAASVHRSMGDADKATYHGRFAGGLLRSILESGDGHAPETAFVVISVAEEYAVLGFLELELRSQTLLTHKGHRFDEIRAHHPQTGKAMTLYFNIDHPHMWLEGRDPADLLASLGAPITPTDPVKPGGKKRSE